MDAEDRHKFTYTFIPNIDQYEPKMFLGLTLYEAFGVAAAFVVPLMAFQSGFGFALAIAGAIFAFAMFKRFESFGNLSLPVYGFKRIVLRFRTSEQIITVPHIHPKIVSQVKVRDFEGEHLATYGSE